VVTEELPTQPSLRRLRQFGVRPKRDLGQNFLIDSNILGVIERAADLGGDDVVLEIGGGLGVLSEHLAAHAAHVHVVELDRALVPALEDALAPTRTRRCTSPTPSTSTSRPSRRRRPRSSPTCPTGSRRARSCAPSRSSTASRAGWPWSSARSASASPPRRAPRPTASPSVLAQLACDVRVHRSIARTVFHPVPNVDSVLVVLDRIGPAPTPDVARLVRPPSPTAARRSRARSR
jgi:16S rRNA (adenine1518-N6/adenine1519-N6)-dimethyltransferase